MDTKKQNRGEKTTKREGSPNPRKQPPEEASQRRQRPEGTPQQRSQRPEGTSQQRPQRRPEASQRPRPEGRPSDPNQRQQGTEAPRQQRNPAQQRREPSQQPRQRPASVRQESGRQQKSPGVPSKAPAKGTQGTRKASRRPEPDDLSSKKRAYGNSKPKKKSSLSVLGKAISATAKESTARRNARLERQGKRSKSDAGKQPLPAVIYTQPQAFNRDRLVVQLLTVAAVVAAFVIGLSVFFKVENIRVSGAEVYTPWAVKEASGIKEGDSLLTFSRTRAGAQIKTNLPYVKDVSFGIRLPDTVNIIIREEDVVYAIKDQDEQWWLMNSQGRVVDQAKKGEASNYTQILGVALEHPMRDQMAVAVEARIVAPNPEPDPTAETEEPVVPVSTVSGAQKLDIALQIVKALEDNDIVGEAASVNVSQTQGIVLWYGTRYQVNLGDSSNLEYKVACMNSAILTMQDYDSGILDCSFTVWPDQIGYTPFS